MFDNVLSRCVTFLPELLHRIFHLRLTLRGCSDLVMGRARAELFSISSGQAELCKFLSGSGRALPALGSGRVGLCMWTTRFSAARMPVTWPIMGQFKKKKKTLGVFLPEI